MGLSEGRPRSRDRTRSHTNRNIGHIRADYTKRGPPPSYEEAVGSGRPSVASVEAEEERITDYPPRYILSVRSKFNITSCEYENWGNKSKQAAFEFRVREEATETKYIICPKTRAHTAFSANYGSNGVIVDYIRDRENLNADLDPFVFPTPANISRDPLLGLDVSTFRAERDSLHSAIRDRRRTTGEFSIFEGEIEEDENIEDEFRVDEKLSNFCSAVVYALKRQYGTFEDLCKIYRALAEDARWRNQWRPE